MSDVILGRFEGAGKRLQVPKDAAVGVRGSSLVGLDLGAGLYWFGPGVSNMKILAPSMPEDFRIAYTYVEARPESVDEDGVEDDGMDAAYSARVQRTVWHSGVTVYCMVPGDGVVAYIVMDGRALNRFGIVRSVGQECVIELMDRPAVTEAAGRRAGALSRIRELVDASNAEYARSQDLLLELPKAVKESML